MMCYPIGNDTTHSHRLVPHKFSQTCQCRAFHFIISHDLRTVFESLYFLVQFRVGQRNSQFPALWPIETIGRDRDTSHHIVTADTSDQFRIGIYYIRSSPSRIPLHKLTKSSFKIKVTDPIPTGIKIKHTIETDRFLGYYRGPDWYMRL